jgi:hypothetical protein
MKQLSLAVMQPYFLPYVGHFSLLRAADQWVVFDTPKFSRKTFVTRNWMSNPDGSATRLGGAITCPPGGSIADATFLNMQSVFDNVVGAVRRWSNRSPHARPLCDFLEVSLVATNSNSVAHVNATLLSSVGAYLGLEKEVIFSSNLSYPTLAIGGPGRWAPSITKSLGYGTYINPEGGRELLNPCDFRSFGANLFFHKYLGPSVTVTRNGVEKPGSILQQIVEFGPAEVSDQISQFSLHQAHCESDISPQDVHGGSC